MVSIDDDAITLQMKEKYPQLMTIDELASFVDGFVSMLPYSNETLKKYGKRRIEQELYRKGVDRDIISEVLEETDFEESELVALIERKYSRYLGDEKGIQKTVNSLLRMGYSYGEIRSALNEIKENSVTDEEVIYD